MNEKKTMDRRAFAAGLSLTAVACGESDGGGTTPGEDGSSGGSSSGGSSGSGDGGSSSMNGSMPGGAAGELQSPTCGEWTPDNIEGPFFTPDSPERSDIRQDEPGPRLTVKGRVLGPDCEPVTDAVLDFWQADEEGAYDNDGYTFRGHQKVDAEGRYELTTIIPGRYLNGAEYRPAHIHVKVITARGTLTTQLYFPDDPYNDVDAFIDLGLLMKMSTDAEGEVGEFDFIVP